ncbi:DoxX family protein [Saccharothrix deserti]|uniref:DoxX family protein n=1 Tax=Saccharothrix deserti TaxID=2593674 RepID=UPI00131A8EC4|nr:DoxX family protein [Saccharothrix deserti]
MNIVLWIIASALAALFLAAGGSKLAQSKEKLAASPNMAWTEDFSPGVLKLIGALEVLAAIGLILPAALDIVPVLVPLAAAGLVLIMIGAAITHAKRKESRAIVTNLVLIVPAVVVAWGRFGPYSFS